MSSMPLGPGSVQNERTLEELLEKWSTLRGNIDDTPVFLAVQICGILQDGKRYSELDMFLKALPLEDIYMKNELIVRAKIAVAFEKRKFSLIYSLIERNKFQNGDDLIEIWDKAHYAEEEHRTQKPLTPLSRFRIRQRFMPPESICPRRERKKTTLPRRSKDILQQWLDENIDNPYPSRDAKEYLSQKANLTTEQVKTWFANARRRMHSARYKRLCCQSKEQTGNECGERASDNNSNYLVNSGTQPRPSNESNHDELNEDVEPDVPPSRDITGGFLYELSNHGDNAGSHPLLHSAAMTQHPELIPSRVSEPYYANVSSNHCDHGETRPLSSHSHDKLTTAPQLELVLPPANVGSNHPHGSTYLPPFRNCFSSFPSNAMMSTPCTLGHSNNNLWFGMPHHLQQYGSGQYGFQQNAQKLSGAERQAVSIFQVPYQQLFSAMTEPSPEKEPMSCHRQTYALSQGPTTPQFSGPVTAHGVVCGSPGQTMRFNAATALLDMSVKLRSSSSAVD